MTADNKLLFKSLLTTLRPLMSEGLEGAREGVVREKHRA